LEKENRVGSLKKALRWYSPQPPRAFLITFYCTRLHITILEPGTGYRVSFFWYITSKSEQQPQKNEKYTIKVIQKGQSMVYSSSEVKDTTINSNINQDTKRR